MGITPLDIRQKQFTLKLFRGLDPSEVDAFLEDVTDSFEAALKENEAQRERIAALEAEVASYRNSERSLKDTLVAAQKMAEDMKGSADREANLKLKEAELEAEKLLRESNRELGRTREQIAELKRIKERFTVRVKGVIEEHMKMLDFESRQPEDEPPRPAPKPAHGAHK